MSSSIDLEHAAPNQTQTHFLRVRLLLQRALLPQNRWTLAAILMILMFAYFMVSGRPEHATYERFRAQALAGASEVARRPNALTTKATLPVAQALMSRIKKSVPELSGTSDIAAYYCPSACSCSNSGEVCDDLYLYSPISGSYYLSHGLGSPSADVYVVQTQTNPSFFIQTLNPFLEGEGGPSWQLHKNGYFEGQTTRVFESLFGACQQKDKNGQSPIILDVGANIGYFSAFGAALGCRVIGFEANSELRPLVEVDIALNGWPASSVKMHSVAVGAVPGELFMSVELTCPRCASVVNPSEVSNAVRVEVVPIASKVKLNDGEEILLVKLDIDGYEIPALKGMLSLFEAQRVRYLDIELNPHVWGRGGAKFGGYDQSHALEVLRALLAAKYQPFVYLHVGRVYRSVPLSEESFFAQLQQLRSQVFLFARNGADLIQDMPFLVVE